MKIGIVTVFYTENCGSVLQATALAEKLRSYGNDVFFVDTRNKLSGHSVKRLVKNCIKTVIKRGSIIPVIKKYKDYSKYIQNNFSIVSPETSLDLVIIGSDTVWDVTSDYFMLSQKVFWGQNFNCKNISTYAASIANAKYTQLDKLQYPIINIKKYRNVSVRDQYSKDYVDQYLEIPATVVCDPTLLHERGYYVRKCKPVDIDNYILLYLFDDPEPKIISKLKKFAQKEKLKIVSMVCIGKRISCADIYIEATIDNFLSYFNSARYILTNTFHGTVFSAIFNKNFVVLDYHKTKVFEFLKGIELLERLTESEIEKLYETTIEYDKINENIDNMRRLSERYIEDILND